MAFLLFTFANNIVLYRILYSEIDWSWRMNRSTKWKTKVFVLGLAAALTFGTVAASDLYQGTATASAAAKEITVDASGAVQEGARYTQIQDAINYIRSLGPEHAEKKTDGPEDGWTITVKAGTYNRFNVLNGVDGLTVKSGEGAVISVLDGSELPSTQITITKDDGKPGTIPANQATRINSGVAVNASGLTLEGLTFRMGTTKKSWQAAAVEATNGDTTMERANGLTVKNCVFQGSGTGNGVFADNGLTTYTLQGNTFRNLSQGTYMEDYWQAPLAITVTGNTYTGCDFAFHGSYDNNANKKAGAGKLTFTGNTVTGTKALRNKVIIQDSPDHGSTLVNVTGNTIRYGLIGTVNLENDQDGINDLVGSPRTANTYGSEGSYYVKAHEPGSIDYYSVYEAPAGSVGRWEITGLDDVDWTDEQRALVKAAIEKANAEQSRTLSVSGLTEKTLIHTFTWFKNAIYWSPYDHGDLTVTKKVAGTSTSQAFRFRITLTGKNPDGKDLSQTTQVFGDLTFKNGVAEFQLKNGEKKQVTGLPAGTAYAVEELNTPAKYKMTSEAASGTIEKGSKIMATFTNTYKKAVKPDTPNPKPDTPKTGDSSDVFLWGALLVTGLAEILLLLAARRKN